MKSPATLTLAQTEGPYYKPNSPERASLIEPGMSGAKLIVTGYVLTPQIYFPGEPGNDRDSIFNPALLANMQDTADGKVATFNFVVNPS